MNYMKFICFLLPTLCVNSYIQMPGKCHYLNSVSNAVIQNECISSKFAYLKNGTIQLSNYQGFFRAFMTTNNLGIYVLNETNQNQYNYINKSPVNIPGGAFSTIPYWSLKRFLNISDKLTLNLKLKISNAGIELIDTRNKTVWKGNEGNCSVPTLIMQYDRNLVLYCGKDAFGNPTNYKWSSNTACKRKMLKNWCGCRS